MMWRCIKKLLVVLSLFGAFSCSSEPELMREIPKEGGGKMEGRVSIAYLKSLYVETPHFVDQDIWIEGLIVGNDRNGNLYKTLVVEDSTGGIVVRLDDEELFLRYKLGHTLQIYCNSLTVGTYGNQVELGVGSATGASHVENIPYGQIASALKLLSHPEQLVLPHSLSFSALSSRYISCLVSFDNVQFAQEEIGLPWGGEEPTNRHLVDSRGDTLLVRTSDHASFAGQLLPRGSGYVEGVLSYFNRDYQLIITDLNHVVMEEDRF